MGVDDAFGTSSGNLGAVTGVGNAVELLGHTIVFQIADVVNIVAVPAVLL